MGTIGKKWEDLKQDPEPIIFTIPEPVTNIKPQKQEPPKEHFILRENWMPELIELEKYFKTVSLPVMVQLNKSAEITNVPLFIDTHFQTLSNYNGNKIFLPYLNRLRELRQFIANNN